ncbi:hypothetical protein [Limnohabitans sp. Rim8]|uniref:hypothetical protein n=1 Tax=Limnohabitans sp. Rim8 TaxID=1100718 RepID=UPI0033065C45
MYILNAIHGIRGQGGRVGHGIKKPRNKSELENLHTTALYFLNLNSILAYKKYISIHQKWISWGFRVYTENRLQNLKQLWHRFDVFKKTNLANILYLLPVRLLKNPTKLVQDDTSRDLMIFI